MTVYLLLWNLKMVCKSPYRYKSIDLKFLSARNWTLLREMFVHSLWLHVQGWSKQKMKMKIIVFHCYLFSYRLWHVRCSFHPSLNIIYGFLLTTLYTHTQLCLTIFFKSGMISTIYHKYSKSFIENITLPASHAIRIYCNNFLI